jgi:hypothetical protein
VFINIVEIQLALMNTVAHFNNQASYTNKNLYLEVHMQYKARDGEVTLTLQPSMKTATLNNWCKTVGQGCGETEEEVVKSALLTLYNNLGGQFTYYQPLRNQFISLANDICHQVGIRKIVFSED